MDGRSGILKTEERKIYMKNVNTVLVPIKIIHKLEKALADLEKATSPYKPEFLAKMYKAKASDLEGKGKSLSQIKNKFM